MTKPVIPANRRRSSQKGAFLRKGEEKQLQLKAKSRKNKDGSSSNKMYWVALFVLALIVLELFTSFRR